MAHVETVAAARVKVDFNRTVGLPILFELRKHWADVTAIIIRNEKKCRRCVGRNFIPGNSQRTGIDDDLEVGMTIHALDRIE